MMGKIKICVVTGSRAEYGLLYWSLREFSEDVSFDLQLIATGMHLSPEFGLTYTRIKEDGFKIDKKVEILMSSDTPVGISKSVGLGVIGFAEAFEQLKPDIIMVLGDRFEVLAACTAAVMSRIPIAHIHGGETTEGSIDEQIRHAITKMSHLHFTSTELHRKRIIQMGENPERVFTVGAPGLDNIKRLNLLNKKELGKKINHKFSERNILVTFHPVTLEKNSSEYQFRCLLNALDLVEDVNIIFTKPNADNDGRIIIDLLDQYVKNNRKRAILFTSMGQINYLSTLKYVDMVVGNSSSGIIEVPSFYIPTVNIGNRQKNRLMPGSVINCSSEANDIVNAIRVGYSTKFRESIKNIQNPYGDGNASKRIKSILSNIKIYENLLTKHFYDINLENI